MLYLIGDSKEKIGIGVIKKIKGQVEAFNRCGLNCSIYELKYMQSDTAQNKILRRIPFVNVHKHWRIGDLAKEDNIYIRNLGEWDSYMIDFFCQVHQENPNCNIVWELPTYPYDGEWGKSVKNWPLLWKDRFYRRYAHKCINRIATLTGDKEIFGIPTLHIQNGVDLSQILPKKIYHSHVLHAIAVSTCCWWHGYDRFIEGLYRYYQDGGIRNIVFHLVGDGEERVRYQQMVERYQLGEHVIFHGFQSGAALDNLYDICSLGIASLGCYRKSLERTADLKTREYIAKGIPFICSTQVMDIEINKKSMLYLKIANDDSPVDIHQVLGFYDEFYQEDPQAVVARLRHYAEQYFSMDVAMKEVVDYFLLGR